MLVGGVEVVRVGLAMEGVVVVVVVQGKRGGAVVGGMVGIVRGAVQRGPGHAWGMRACPRMQQADNVEVIRSGAAAMVSDTELHECS